MTGITTQPPYVTGSKRVTLVDERDKEVGEADIFAAHRYPVQLHRACSVWLWREGEVLLQQRSQYKVLGANWWGNAFCANVRPGETVAACAIRRGNEELGIPSAAPALRQLQPLYSFLYKAWGDEEYGEYEFDHVLGGKFTGRLAPHPEEVAAISWVPWSALRSWAMRLDYPTPAETTKLSWSELKKMTKTQTFTWLNHYLVCPWTILMLRDQRLQNYFDKT